jgi:hypothetical protein
MNTETSTEGFHKLSLYLSKYLYSLKINERITKDIYDKKHEEYQDQIQLLEIELAEHTKADYEYQTTVAVVVSLARRAKTIFENSSDIAGKRAFLNYILQNPTVNGKKLYFSIASPFNLVLQLASTNRAPRPGLEPGTLPLTAERSTS